jgi:hypothetical protein
MYREASRQRAYYATRPATSACGCVRVQLLEWLPTAAHEERDTISIVWHGMHRLLEHVNRYLQKIAKAATV